MLSILNPLSSTAADRSCFSNEEIGFAAWFLQDPVFQTYVDTNPMLLRAIADEVCAEETLELNEETPSGALVSENIRISVEIYTSDHQLHWLRVIAAADYSVQSPVSTETLTPEEADRAREEQKGREVEIEKLRKQLPYTKIV